MMRGVILLLRFVLLCDLYYGAYVVSLLVLPVRSLQWRCSLVWSLPSLGWDTERGDAASRSLAREISMLGGKFWEGMMSTQSMCSARIEMAREKKVRI